jgi:hypothetical protein
MKGVEVQLYMRFIMNVIFNNEICQKLEFNILFFFNKTNCKIDEIFQKINRQLVIIY